MKSPGLALTAAERLRVLCHSAETIEKLLDCVGGLLLNAVAGWWWADPAAALAMAPIIAQEGRKALKGEPCPTCD